MNSFQDLLHQDFRTHSLPGNKSNTLFRHYIRDTNTVPPFATRQWPLMQQLWLDAITVHNYIDDLLVMAESQQEIEAGAELVAASLAILDGQAHHFYTDSWVVHKSLTLWLTLPLFPGRLACTEIPCMGTDTWQQNWPHVQEHPFKVRHVSAHQKDDSLEAKSNREVDDRTSAGEPAQAMNAHPACGHRSAPTARAWDMTHSQTPLPLRVYKTFAHN